MTSHLQTNQALQQADMHKYSKSHFSTKNRALKIKQR